MSFSHDSPAAKKKLGIYVHVPFCRKKCSYCDFYSMVSQDDYLMEEYVDAVLNHMKSYKNACYCYEPDTVFIGGGTPTVLPAKQLIRLIRGIRNTFQLSKKCEFSIEANPATVTFSLLRRLRRQGVNRISFGMQSSIDRELKTLGRIHNRQQFENSFRMARAAGFENINIDVMFGIPGQTMETLYQTLSYVIGLHPEHISLYDLRVEPNTPFGRMLAGGNLRLLDEDIEADMYLSSVKYLANNGYLQYEISNFAKKGKACNHNLKYWNCEDYLGFGPAAHSYFCGNRFSIVANLQKYIQGTVPMDSEVNILDLNEQIMPRQSIGEYVMLRLRLRAGISEKVFFERFGKSFEELYGKKLNKYLISGHAIHNNGRYALTPKGLFVSNYILTDILDYEDLGALGFAAQ